MNILVTGGASGLGRCIVELCAKNQSCKVFFTYCKSANSAEEIAARYENVYAIQVDYTSRDSINEFISQIEYIDIDVLVNNAWVGKPNGTYFHKTVIETFQEAFENNILPLISITQACISVFRKKKKGKIITVLTSYLLNLPPMGFSVYTASKAYIEQLAKCWSKENAKFGITCNCVSPEYMQTGFADVDERIIEQMEQDHPLKCLLQPAEVAKVVMFLMESSNQINGVNIPINAAQNVIK